MPVRIFAESSRITTVFGKQQRGGSHPLIAGSGIIGAEIDHKFAGVASGERAVDQRFHSGKVPGCEPGDEIDGELRMTKRSVALAIKRIRQRPRQRINCAVQTAIEQSELAVDGGPRIVKGGTDTLNAQRNAGCGHDVQNFLNKVVCAKKSPDGGFDVPVIHFARNGFVGSGIDQAEIVERDAAFADIVIRNLAGNGGLPVGDNEDLIGSLRPGYRRQRGAAVRAR